MKGQYQQWAELVVELYGNAIVDFDTVFENITLRTDHAEPAGTSLCNVANPNVATESCSGATFDTARTTCSVDRCVLPKKVSQTTTTSPPPRTATATASSSSASGGGGSSSTSFSSSSSATSAPSSPSATSSASSSNIYSAAAGLSSLIAPLMVTALSALPVLASIA
ncbi:hypothetical protein HK405_013259 [Cladochytrium tenue]|nr:hypothetical protein HK405_013259 [Cladochytrium tenue]